MIFTVFGVSLNRIRYHVYPIRADGDKAKIVRRRLLGLREENYIRDTRTEVRHALRVELVRRISCDRRFRGLTCT